MYIRDKILNRMGIIKSKKKALQGKAILVDKGAGSC